MNPIRATTKHSNGRGFAQSLLILAFFCMAVVASADEPVKPEKASPHPTTMEIMERSKREFPTAYFYKPAERDSSAIEYKLAPLIVEEFHARLRRIGTTNNRYTNYDKPPFGSDMVYFHADKISVGNEKLDQMTYLWWYDAGHHCRPVPLSTVIRTRGVRIVLGPDDMPLLWEALTEGSYRVFFVSQSLEAAAKAEFGDPLPGRKSSIERSAEETPGVVVARLLDDGPVPMGPYIYIDATPARAVTAILCRCMASQFDEVVEPVIEYQLEPLQSLNKTWLRESAGVDLDKLLNPEPLDKLFRWPKLQP